MSKRGSMQFLLPFFRSRAGLGWLGGTVTLFILIGLVQTLDGFPLLARSEFAQALRQSAWEKALSGQAEQAPWPWEDTTFMPAAKVPRLGLSAAILSGPGQGAQSWQVPSMGTAIPDSDTDLRDVAVGDRITVTGADGLSHVYRVTGRRVVDPHLAETDDGMAENAVSLVTCWPLDPCVEGSLRLVIQATPDNPSPAPAPSTEHRL